MNYLKDEKIINEIKELVEDINTAKDKICIYGELMKQIFLSGSENN